MKSEFRSVDELDGLYVARSGKLSCTAMRLMDGSLCLYSPVAGLEKTLLRQIDELGKVSALLAPNHYHNKGLAAHVEAFPDATLYCSAAARSRLSRITGLDFNPLDGLQEHFTTDQILHEPDGLKTGEVWVQINSNHDRALIVTDAFSSTIQPPGKYGDEVVMLGTFPRYGIKDASLYRMWATKFLTMTSPTLLLPCHGSPVRCSDLTAKLLKQIDETI